MLATRLDISMLEGRGVWIFPGPTPDKDLPHKTGVEVSRELGGRYLLRYVLPDQVGRYTAGSTEPHWVTPTPYAPLELVPYLFLPNPNRIRTHVMLLNPVHIPTIAGPRYVNLGSGIEYLLRDGFPMQALVTPWEMEIR